MKRSKKATTSSVRKRGGRVARPDEPVTSENPPAGEEPGSAIEPEVEVLSPDELDGDVEDGSGAAPEEVESEPAGSGRRELVPYNALTAYLQEISRHPQLSREEEHALAVAYRENKDLDAAYKLVVSNLWLVVKMAREYERAARNLLDLIQEGNIGLMEAVKNFDPYRGVRFPSYAIWWVRAYIIRYIMANWRMVKIGTTQAQRKLFFNLRREKEKLEREGFVPAPKLLAEKLNVRESDVIEMEQRMGASSEVSVDAPIQSESGSTDLLSLLPSSTPSAEEVVERSQMRDLIRKSLDEFETTLNPNERIVFRERMLSEERTTLQDISDKVHLSRERVRQIENEIREKLKAFLSTKFGGSIDQLEFD